MPEGVALGFDYGQRRVGVAVGNTLTGKAQPLVTLEHHDGMPDWATLDELIAQWQPTTLIVGLPLQASGASQKMTRRATNFAQEARGRYKLAVHAVDERYTTIEAIERLKSARASGSRGRRTQRGDVDAMAAQTILESWLSGHLEETA